MGRPWEHPVGTGVPLSRVNWTGDGFECPRRRSYSVRLSCPNTLPRDLSGFASAPDAARSPRRPTEPGGRFDGAQARFLLELQNKGVSPRHARPGFRCGVQCFQAIQHGLADLRSDVRPGGASELARAGELPDLLPELFRKRVEG